MSNALMVLTVNPSAPFVVRITKDFCQQKATKLNLLLEC